MTSSQSAVATGTTSAVATGQFGETTVADIRKPLRPTSTTLMIRIFPSAEVAADLANGKKGSGPGEKNSSIAGQSGIPNKSPHPTPEGSFRWTDSSPLVGLLTDIVLSSGGALGGEEEGVLLASVSGVIPAVLIATRIQCVVAGFVRFSSKRVKGVAVGITAATAMGAPALRKKGGESTGRGVFRVQAMPGQVLVIGAIRKQIEGLPGIALRKVNEAGSGRAGVPGPGLETSEIILPDLSAMVEAFVPAPPSGGFAALPAFDSSAGAGGEAGIVKGAPASEAALRMAKESVAGASVFVRGAATKVGPGLSGMWATVRDAVSGGLDGLPQPIRKNFRWIALGAAALVLVGLVLILRPGLFGSKSRVAEEAGQTGSQVQPIGQTTPTEALGKAPSLGQTGQPGTTSPVIRQTQPAAQSVPAKVDVQGKTEPAEKTKSKGKDQKIVGDGKTQGNVAPVEPPKPPVELKQSRADVGGLTADQVEGILRKADRLNDDGKYADAIRLYQTVLRQEPGNQKAQSGKQLAQQRQGQVR